MNNAKAILFIIPRARIVFQSTEHLQCFYSDLPSSYYSHTCGTPDHQLYMRNDRAVTVQTPRLVAWDFKRFSNKIDNDTFAVRRIQLKLLKMCATIASQPVFYLYTIS